MAQFGVLAIPNNLAGDEQFESMSDTFLLSVERWMRGDDAAIDCVIHRVAVVSQTWVMPLNPLEVCPSRKGPWNINLELWLLEMCAPKGHLASVHV